MFDNWHFVYVPKFMNTTLKYQVLNKNQGSNLFLLHLQRQKENSFNILINSLSLQIFIYSITEPGY